MAARRVVDGGGARKPRPFLPAALGDSAQRQDVEADVADADRLVQVELDDGDLLGGALVAQQAPTVPAARKERGLTQREVMCYFQQPSLETAGTLRCSL